MIPVDAQIWTEADVRRDGFSLETVLGEINSRGAGVKIALIDASRRNPFERRFRSFSAGLAPVIAPNGTLVMYSAALSSVCQRQWQRPQPVRAGIAQGNSRSRPDGRGNPEQDPRRRHPRLARASRCRGFRRRWPRIFPLSRAAQAGRPGRRRPPPAHCRPPPRRHAARHLRRRRRSTPPDTSARRRRRASTPPAAAARRNAAPAAAEAGRGRRRAA